MTDSQNNPPVKRQRGSSVWLIILAVAALAVFSLLLRQWQANATGDAVSAAVQTDNPARLEMSQRLTQPGAGSVTPGKTKGTLLLPLFAFALALGAGVCMGRFWPGRLAVETDVPTPDVVGQSVDTPDAPEKDELFVEPEPVVTAPPAATIDELPLDEALAAKDEVIESLENIVKENRDRWSNFEVERDELNEKIRNLNAELRIASDIIEGLHGDSDDVTYDPPQVLGRA